MRSDSKTERAFRRRFALLVRLHRGPHRRQELITALERENLFAYRQQVDSQAAEKQRLYQFRRDIQALRGLGCDVSFDPKTDCYAWHNSPFGLSLDNSQLTTFAMLLKTFDDSTVLHAADIQALLAFLKAHLPEDQQKSLATRSRSFDIDLHETTDYRNAHPQTIERIEKALQNRRQLQFHYRTLRDGKERRHVIEPVRLVFEHGHVYLYGWSLEYQKELRFRLDYIVQGSAEILPTRIAPSHPSPISYVLRYELSPVIARNGVSQHFPDQTVEPHTDGSATVTARITDLFEARRILLSYGENCTVLEPAPLVEQMRVVAAEFSKKYGTRGG